MENDYALVVGIQHYRSLGKLDSPIADANKFRNWLISKEGGNLPEINCRYIESSQDQVKPLQFDIDENVQIIYETGKLTGFRRFYFYFTGHGLGVAWNENALCLPNWSDVYKNSALSSAGYLKSIINCGLFKEVYFFLDCCRNRKKSTPLHPTFEWESEVPESCQSFVAYATEFNNPAFEAERWKEDTLSVSGYFTQALLQGLEGAATNRAGNITTNSLKGFLTTRVKELSNEQGQNQGVQFEDTFNPEGIIVGNAVRHTINVNVRFTEDSNMLIEGPDFSVVWQGPSSGGPINLSLPKGIYSFMNTDTKRQAYVRIDGVVNPFTYEF